MRQLATKLQITQRTVDRWLAEQILPAKTKVKIGDTTRFREGIVDQWIASGCPGATDERS